MSIHFAPQWVKPIKPSGASITPTAEHPSTLPKSAGSGAAQHPFPALSSGGGHHHPSSQQSTANPALSYSRATHTPTTPGFPADSSYFPYTAEPNGTGHGEVRHPFRYSREQILALWDEEKVKETPIELVDMLDGQGVLLAQGVVRPNGLRELSDIEKKLLATSVHPPNPSRRAGQGAADGSGANGTPAARRTIGANAGGEKVSTPGRGPTAFGAFGTGKIGTIGGGLISPGANVDGRAPGALGGGFGGVGRRTTRKAETADGSAWRPARTASGNFEGVLGFGGAAASPVANTAAVGTPVEANGGPQSPWKEKTEQPKEKPAETFGSGGGPGWGTGQKKWRLAAGRTAGDNDASRTLEIPITNRENLTESVAASPSATPLPERDAQIAEETPSQLATPAPAPPAVEAPPTLQEKEDLGAVEWLYRDPGGQEQGPFTGSQMHDWYSHSYFTDDLPLRRATETTFRPLADLKAATGNAVQPFLTPVRPRLPPNLPIPAAVTGGLNGVTDSLRNIGLSTPVSAMSSPQAPFNQYIPERAVHSPNHFAPHNAFAPQGPAGPGAYLPSPGQWGAPQPRLTSFGSVGMPSPIGSAALAYGQPPQHAPQVYSPVIGGPIGRDGRDFFSPGVGVGAHPQSPSPWGAPQQQPMQHQPYPQSIPQPVWQLPQQHQPAQPVQNQPAEPSEPAPPIPQEEPSYFPPAEQAAPVENQPEVPAAEARPETIPEPEAEQESTDKDAHSEDSEPVPETPAHVETSPAQPESKPAPAPPVSVWGKTKTPAPSAPSSRKSSIVAATTPAPLQQVTPAKPSTPAAAVPKPAPVEAAVEEKPVVAEKTPASARPAPWAEKEGRSQSTGPSLREIQEAEAREAQARKAARAAAASPAPVSAGPEEIPQNLTWGLPTSAKGAIQAAPVATSPAPAVWGSGDAGPKKTLKQIQEEEEKQRKAKAAQAAKAALGAASQGSAPAASKRGYADLAATSQTPGAGWTTVGATKTPAATTPAAARPTAASIVKPVSAVAKPATPAAVKPKANGVNESAGPSLEFIKWAKQSLDGLKINVDEFVQMILTFPIDPPAAEKPTYLEMISETVYANSNTLDGKRFAQEFFTKRKADATKPKAPGQVAVAKSSLADVVKSVPKKAEDAGFRVVKAKGKKKN